MDRRTFINDMSKLGVAAMAVGSAGANAQESSSNNAAASGPAQGEAWSSPFDGISTFDEPKFEFVFEIDLDFTRVQNITNMPTGAGRGAVYLDAGKVSGPHLNGRATPDSGGDWALFRPDDVLAFDARYMLEEDDGTLILLRNNGYLWGRYPDTIAKIQDWIFNNGPVVPEDEYYLRAFPTFEVETGKHDWLMRYVIVGIGRRKEAGNIVRYYALL
jgi:hypothetical protein